MQTKKKKNLKKAYKTSTQTNKQKTTNNQAIKIRNCQTNIQNKENHTQPCKQNRTKETTRQTRVHKQPSKPKNGPKQKKKKKERN